MRNKKLTPAQQAQLEQLQAQVKHAEDHGQFDTAHHEILARFRAELGLIPAGKIEGKKDEVENGKSDL